MCPKNAVNTSDYGRSSIKSVPKEPLLSPSDEFKNLRGLPSLQQKAVRDLVAKVQALREAGMHSSADRLERQALRTVRRYQGTARRNRPNPFTGV